MSRNKEYPKEWNDVRLDEVCNQRNEIVLPSGKGEHKFVGLEHINSGEIKIHAYQLDTDVRSSKFKFYKGDLLYGKLRPYLDKAVIADFDGICSTDLLVLRVNNKAFEEFLIYLIHSNQFVRNSISATSGTNHPRTSWKEISKFKFRLPPLPEQRRIAEVLGTVDSAIQKVGGAIEKTEGLKKGLMQRLLTRGIGHERFRFSKELGCEVPEEWEVITIDEICKVKRGASPRPIGDPSYFSDSGRGWIRISDVTDAYKHLKKTSQYLSKKGEERSVKVNPGDLIMSICATIGKPIILDIEACIHDGFVWFSELSNDINSEYLFYALQKNEVTFSSKRQTGTQGNLNTTLVGKTHIPFPPLPEQRRIAEILNAADKKLGLERRRKEKLESVKKGLMNDLLTGKKRTKVM